MQDSTALPYRHAAESAAEAALVQELAKWRDRVPKLASALRQRSDEADLLRAECESLRARNQQLFETTGLASAQLAALTELVGTYREEIARLEGCVREAERANAAREQERRHLSQQIEALRARVSELESELSRADRARASDDLTRIRGVGRRLAEQLNTLGIFRYEQIAGLVEADLCCEDHALFPHRGRILRDGWIVQAAQLACG